MALDGLFLSKIKDELTQNAVGLRVDKVQQPSRDEIVLSLRGKSGNYRLLICVRADSPRINFTVHSSENPASPPMFCMLLRKYLTAAKITGVRQQELDRILFIDFDASNEIGDRISLTLVIEIMGKYSNLILISSDGKVIDAAKRVDITTSSVRQILPGIQYELPPKQDKLCIESCEISKLVSRITAQQNKYLSSAILSVMQGVSPIITREIANLTAGEDVYVYDLSADQINRLADVLSEIKSTLHEKSEVYMICTPDGKPKELSFLEITQYGDAMTVKEYSSPSMLLDDFFIERDRMTRISQRGHEMFKLLNTLTERTARKLSVQKQELEKCAEKDDLKLYGELITSNIHRLQKGSSYYEVENYYDNMKKLTVKANPALTPLENANKYYKDYRKAKTAEVMLAKLIDEGENELVYFESVLDELSRADTDSELSAIREELCQGGYLKPKGGKKQKQPKILPPHEFCSSDGYRIFVGRNNIQNDRLSMKVANNNDMWLHTQSFPGSHVIIENKLGEVSDQSIEEAAVIAACYSKAGESSLVPVDYTKVRALKKPVGAKPGKVIYHEYYTIIVKPDRDLCEKLRVK